VLIVLVGGPQDGREIDAAAPLLPAYRLPRRGSFLSLREQQGPPTSSLEVDEYALGVTLGHPSRDDAGRVRYLFVRTNR